MFCICFFFHLAILVMYLTQYLLYSPPDATVLYHAFLTISFMMSIFGAIIADSWLGKYKTVLYMIIAYAVGMVVLNLGSIPVLQLPSRYDNHARRIKCIYLYVLIVLAESLRSLL